MRLYQIKLLRTSFRQSIISTLEGWFRRVAGVEGGDFWGGWLWLFFSLLFGPAEHFHGVKVYAFILVEVSVQALYKLLSLRVVVQ